MKYAIILADGSGGEKLAELNNRTTLEAANLSNIDALAKHGETGMVRTIPDGCKPGSDAGNLSIMGYDPLVYLTGRSPLEAASIGIDMSDTDVSFRVNIITLEGEGDYEDLIIKDHSSGEITTEEAKVLVKALADEFNSDEIEIYPGVSYRHCMIWHNGSMDCELTPPHDRLGKKAGPNLPKGEGSEMFINMMKRSYEILKDHPVNKARIEKGLNPANSMWIWGEGKKPSLTSFEENYGISGAAISAVDLVKGIAICAGLDSIDVPGVTGNLNTNYEGKKDAAIKAFEDGADFVYVHLEGPDECGHAGDIEGKILAEERIDEQIVKPIYEYLKSTGEDFRLMVVPDHKTPIEVRTHTAAPVPYMIYDSRKADRINEDNAFNEEAGQKGPFFESGDALARYFFGKGE